MSHHFVGVCLFLSIIVLFRPHMLIPLPDTLHKHHCLCEASCLVQTPCLFAACLLPQESAMSSFAFMGFWSCRRQVCHDNTH